MSGRLQSLRSEDLGDVMNEPEIAAFLRCSIRTLYRLKALERRTRAGFFPPEIPGLRGRYWKEDVIRCFKRGDHRRDDGRRSR
jgi:hypothetical protein